MKIIDFARKGNVVRFYLGKDDLEEYYGDDWDDTPYEHNADRVYNEFVSGYKDIAFPFDDLVLEPCDGEYNSPWCKDDMVARKVPCIIVVPKEVRNTDWGDWGNENFATWIGSDKVQKFYFGDQMEPDVEVKEGDEFL